MTHRGRGRPSRSTEKHRRSLRAAPASGLEKLRKCCLYSLFLNPEMVLSQLILLIVGQEGVFTPRVSLSSGYLIPSDFLLGFFLHDAGGD